MHKSKKFNPFKKKRYFDSENSYNQDEGYVKSEKNKLGRLPFELISYYRNVLSTLQNENEFEDNESKEQFLTNVYAALKEDGVQVSQNQTVSRILEMLFSHSQPHHMIEFFKVLSKELTLVTFDRFASHVFQALVRYLPAMYEVKEEGKDSSTSLKKSIEQTCTFMDSHMRDIMTHTYASHVLRSLLEALGGVEVHEEVVKSRMSRSQKQVLPADTLTKLKVSGKRLSVEFKSSFDNLKDKIIKFCNYEDHLKDINYCPVLQTVLLILHKSSPDEYEELADKIIQNACIVEAEDNSNAVDATKRLPHIVQNDIGSYLIELLISLANEAQLKKLFDVVFKDKLVYFAVHPIANYVLQKLISTVTDTTLMDEIMKTILQYTEDILAVNHLGIITKLTESCQRNGNRQNDLLKALMTAFHCYEPESRQIKFVPLLASLKTFETYFASEEGTESEEKTRPLLTSINIHGSLILQQLLQFKNTKLVASSLLALSTAEVAAACCDKCGSHIVDVFFQSKTVPDKYKNALIKHLQSTYVNIACNQIGSRCLENIWKCCSLNQRQMIAEELCKSQERVESDRWGHHVNRICALFKFKQRKKEWLEIQGASFKRQKLLEDFLQGTGPKKKSKKDKRSTESKTVAEEIPEMKPEYPTTQSSKAVHKKTLQTPSEEPGERIKKKGKKDKSSKESKTVTEEVTEMKQQNSPTEGREKERKKDKSRSETKIVSEEIPEMKFENSPTQSSKSVHKKTLQTLSEEEPAEKNKRKRKREEKEDEYEKKNKKHKETIKRKKHAENDANSMDEID